MKNNLRYFAILAALGLCFYLTITFALPFASRQGNGQAAAPKYFIQVVLKAKANPPDFWRIVQQGVDLAGEEFNLSYEVNGPTHESDIEEQMRMMQRAIDKKPDAIVLAAADFERLVPLCEKAVKNGIKLVMLDSDVDFQGKHSFVGTDNFELGQKLGALVNELLQPAEKFGVVGHVESSSTAIERQKGLLDAVPNTRLKLAGFAYCNSSVELAKEQATAMLQNNPDISCMVGLNESSALGIASAVFELGLAGKVHVVACDSSEEQIKFIENGTIQAVVVQKPFSMGYLAMQAAVQLLEGNKVDKNINTGSVIITKDEMYRPENQKLLFPFVYEKASSSLSDNQTMSDILS